MMTHAEYHAGNPLPALIWCCQPMTNRSSEPMLGIGRVHKIENHDDSEIASMTATREQYVAALSKTEWIGSHALADALNVSQGQVKDMMSRKHMEAITISNKICGKWVWRLK